MDEGNIRFNAIVYSLIAEMHSVIAKIEAMKAANMERMRDGYALAYIEENFENEQKRLEHISKELRNQ